MTQASRFGEYNLVVQQCAKRLTRIWKKRLIAGDSYMQALEDEKEAVELVKALRAVDPDLINQLKQQMNASFPNHDIEWIGCEE